MRGIIGVIAGAITIMLYGCGSSSHAGSGSASRSDTTSSATSATTTSGTASARTIPIPAFALPSKTADCHGATSAGAGAMRIPVRVGKVGPNVAVLVNVCIDGKGPFPFVVDTGASSVTIDAGLADRLGLPRVGSVETFSGAGCTASGQERRLTSWSVAGVALRPQTATGARVPDFGGPGQPVGLIGSDAWGAFGAVRIDFRHGDLVVPGREGQLPRKEAVIKKPASSPLPSVLLTGRPQMIAPMAVDASPGQTLLFVQVAFGSHPAADFTPDTGASISVVDSTVAKQARLDPADVKARQNTVCSVVTAPEVLTGSWSIAGEPLHPQPIATTSLLTSGPAAGLLGSDQMSRFGSVLFDYRGARLVLGAG